MRDRLLLLFILLAGTALRLFRLGADSLWYDETVSTLLAGSPLSELIRHTAADIHPPLYYVLLRGWLIALGYPTGRADASGIGLEFVAGFFSLVFGVLLIALTYALARRFVGPRAAPIAAALVALSPYHIWYGQEVRMYTLGAGLGVVATMALAAGIQRRPAGVGWRWWAVYAVAAAAGMYTLYYFAFLLIALNGWALIRIARGAEGRRGESADLRIGPSAQRHSGELTGNFSPFISHLSPLLLANLAAALLYAPWIPIAFRQATDPPVPPWRTAPTFLASIAESWNALALGQSAPAWTWPVAAAVLGVYVAGLAALANRRTSFHVSRLTFDVALLPIATFGPLLLILLISLATPLYHVRYLFTYSPAFYVVWAAGLAWLWALRRAWRLLAAAIAVGWLAAAAVSLHAFWFDPWYRPDDHRAAVRMLQARWRPGDVLLVNAGYVYPPLLTYWQGPVAARVRLTDPLPAPRPDAALVIVMTGHGDDALAPGQRLGWGDPRSDFFAMPLADADR
ncbi:MAG: glycosyltransferase family 39 protein, partial [Anaerolineae bacterium]